METRKHARQAFALITVLVVSSVLMLFTLACWQRFMLCNDLVILREQYQEHFYLTEIVLNKGVLLVQQNPDWLTSKQLRTSMPFEFDVTTEALSQENLGPRLHTRLRRAGFGFQIPFDPSMNSGLRVSESGMTIKQFTAAIIISVPDLRAGARAKKRTKNLEQNFLIVSAQLRESGKVVMVLRCTVTAYKREPNGTQDTQFNNFPIIVDNYTIGSSF